MTLDEGVDVLREAASDQQRLDTKLVKLEQARSQHRDLLATADTPEVPEKHDQGAFVADIGPQTGCATGRVRDPGLGELGRKGEPDGQSCHASRGRDRNGTLPATQSFP